MLRWYRCFVLRGPSSRPQAANADLHHPSLQPESLLSRAATSCIQSSAQFHIAFTITFAIIAVESGFIMVQEEPKAAYVGFGRSQEHHDAEELVSAVTCLEFPGLAIQ